MDECFDIGGVRVERHGRFVLMQNTRTQEQQEVFNRAVEENFPLEKQKFSDLVDTAIDAIIHCDPVLLLRLGYLAVSLNRIWHGDDEEEIRTRELEFVQSILVTHKSIPDLNEGLEAMRMHCFHALHAVEEMYLGLIPFSIYYRHMASQLTDNEDIVGFIADTQMMYLVRGSRDVHFHERYFALLLKPHDSTFRSRFGMSAEDIIQGISLLAKHLFYDGISLLRKYAKVMRNIDRNHSHKTSESLYLKQHEEFVNQVEDIERFNVGKITGWDCKLMEALALPLAETNAQFTYDYQFWPIDDLPIKDKPFVHIGEYYYCFDYYSFVDNIYRALFNVIRVGDRTGIWSKPQTAAIEGAVGEVFSNLLPGCQQLRNVLYNPTGRLGDDAELDLVVFAPGMTFVVEAKGVWLQHGSPLLNFEKVRAFYENGIAKASKQSARFKSYLENTDNVVFRDANGDEVWRGNRDSLGKICRMCVTVDSENTMTTSTMRLKDISIDARGLVCISLDDFLIYERYFDSPMMFLAYMDYRCDQTQYDYISTADELEYLGLFIRGRKEAERFLELCRGDAVLHTNDYCHELDAFFQSLDDPSFKKPEVYMPRGVKKLMDDIWRTSIPDKARLAVYLTSLDMRCKDWLSDKVEDELTLQHNGDHQRIRSTFSETEDAACGLSLLVNTQWGQQLSENDISLKLKGIMCKFNEKLRDLLTLEYDPAGNLVAVCLRRINIADLCVDEQKVSAMNEVICKRVLSRVIREHGVPGRNDQCPCGSGKKYKKCCGR